MKRLVQAVFLLVCAAALGLALYYLIRERSGAAAAARPVADRQLVLSTSPASPEEREAQAEREAAVNKISALPNEVILDVATYNLDQDEGDEQVLTVRKTDRADGRLSIVVADYIPQRRSWIRSWEGETLTTKLTTFSLQAKDLIGDHNLSILCSGMNDAGEQTISVFRRSETKSSGGGIAYEPICELAADAVAVDEIERSEGYHLGQTAGASWLVLAYRRDRDSQNLLDQVKESWLWDSRKGIYVKSGEEKIPGAQVERAIVSKLLTGSEKDFESFLQGVWYEAGKAPSDRAVRLLVFDRAGSLVTFYTVDAQEVFAWIKSDPTRYGIYARCRNMTVENLIRLMDIELTGSDTISVRIFEDLRMKADPEDRWDGIYRRLSQSEAENLARLGGTRPQPLFKLEGPYRSADGSELSFAQPRYSLKRGENVERGAFGVYRLGSDTVLDLSALREDGFSAGRKTYRATYTEIKSGKDLIKRLVLAPAVAAITGLELLEEQSLVFEQRIKG